LNATNTTNAYASKFARSGSAYASQITYSGSPLLVYVPAATTLAGIIAVIVYYYRASSEKQDKARKILERKQTGFFRPKRTNNRGDRSQTRKLSAVECLQIMEVLANATDEVTTLNEENGDQYSDEELPEGVAETVLKEHFGKGIDFESSSSSDLSVDSAEQIDEEDGDNESTPTNRSRDPNRSRSVKTEKSDSLFTPGDEQWPEQSHDEPLHYDDEEIDAQDDNISDNKQELPIQEAMKPAEQVPESIMSDDENYTRYVGLGRSGSPDSFATANIAYDAPRPRRSSWHGEGVISS
jgi:hypothetical protein